jgi:hypothetical protein
MELEFEDGGTPAPVRVDPSALARTADNLRDVAARLSTEVPRASDLPTSPAGWAMRSALAALTHEVNMRLHTLSTELTHVGDGLRGAALGYDEADLATARRLTPTAGRADR